MIDVVCPQCAGDFVEITTMGCPNGKDSNRVNCHNCGWQGRAQDWKDIAALKKELSEQADNTARDEILPGECPACHGCGNVEISHINQCYHCRGTGKTSPVA